MKKDKRIDSYIAKSADFAKPILEHLRSLAHQNILDVEETIKWSFPHFEYKNNIVCSMASFKKHCAFGFWLGPVMDDPHNIIKNTAMGQLGKIEKLSDLPSDKILSQYILQAIKLIDKGVKLPKKISSEKTLEIPEYFIKVLKKNKKANEIFDKFSYSHKKEYVEWITEAKTETTRNKRMETAIEWLSEGKDKNWKYK